jgi:hypothetical protein
MKRFIVVLIGLIFLFVGVAFAQPTTLVAFSGKADPDKALTIQKADDKKDKKDEDSDDKEDSGY